MSVTVIKEGTPFYSGKYASIPERAEHDIQLDLEWAMFAYCSEDKLQKFVPSMERNFLSQPEKGGGVTTFATI